MIPQCGCADPGDHCADLAQAAVSALLAELELFPKPGLVSPMDSGSHRDMDFALLKASALCLHPCFRELARLGAAGASFESDLVPSGIRAEQHMMQVTGGVNTHRGAIFSMGLLVAATASLRTCPPHPAEIREALLVRWGPSLQLHADIENIKSHPGARRESGGARSEAAAGFPSIFEMALPAYAGLLKEGFSPREAGIQTLFLLMSSVPDTNILHRGGDSGAKFAAQRSLDFLRAGGITNPSWPDTALRIHAEFVDRNLSPGGSADLLAGTFFVHAVTEPQPPTPSLHDPSLTP